MARPISSIQVLGGLLTAGLLSGVLIAAQASSSTGTQPGAKPPAGTQPPPAPKVTVNRTVPTVAPRPSELTFRAAPSMGDIVNARVFREPLVPVGGAPTDAENVALAHALLKFAKGDEAGSDVALRQFLADFP